MYLIFPGRHHLLSNFQFDYLKSLIQSNALSDEPIVGEIPPNGKTIKAIVFAVTSANHYNTRRNPIAFYLRAMAIQSFAADLGIPFFVYGINDVGVLDDFASYTIKFIAHNSNNKLELNPKNSYVVCSTPVLEMYKGLGFTIFGAELKSQVKWTYKAALPWEIVERFSVADNWERDRFIQNNIHLASLNMWKQYDIPAKVKLLFDDDLISDDGDITSSRDYNAYVRQMDEIAELKFKDTANYIQSGRIGDIGCAVGSWIKLATEQKELAESDFYGIEVARPLFEICQQRKLNQEFSNPNVFFAKKNAITQSVFQNNSMDTIHTSSLTHEIESYGSRRDLIKFIQNRFNELRPGGVWINRDVIGPNDKDKMVYLELKNTDGRNEDYNKIITDRAGLQQYLDGLSSFAKFLRFAIDFRKEEGYQLNYSIEEINGKSLIHLHFEDACEYLSKKDYTGNWLSEMHERFCFWSYQDWLNQLNASGFIVDPQSHAFRNKWIIKNRWKPVAQLFEKKKNKLKKIAFPNTHAILIARKK